MRIDSKLRAGCRRELPRASRVRVCDRGVALEDCEDCQESRHDERDGDRGEDLARAPRRRVPAGQDVRDLKSRCSFTVDVEQVEANGRGNERIHGGDVGRMATQEGAHPGEGGPRRLTIYFATLD